MKKLLFLSSLILIFALPARAQMADSRPSTVRPEQLTVGIRRNFPSMNQEERARVANARLDSAAHSAAHNIGVGAAIGAVVGIGAGVVASRRKQSVEVDIGTTAYVLLGAASGAILGALVGLVVHSSR